MNLISTKPDAWIAAATFTQSTPLRALRCTHNRKDVKCSASLIA
jgi:hypothetical protein